MTKSTLHDTHTHTQSRLRHLLAPRHPLVSVFDRVKKRGSMETVDVRIFSCMRVSLKKSARDSSPLLALVFTECVHLGLSDSECSLSR